MGTIDHSNYKLTYSKHRKMTNDCIRAALERLMLAVEQDRRSQHDTMTLIAMNDPIGEALDAARVALAVKSDSNLYPQFSLDPSNENQLTSLLEDVTAAVTPLGGYEVTDDTRDCGQMVNGEWWLPCYGCDSLDWTLDRIRNRISVIILNWYRTALTAVPEKGPSDEGLLSLDDLRDAWNAQADAFNNWDQLGVDEIVWWAQSQVLARWGRPTTPSVPAEGKVGELVAWLREKASWCTVDDYRDGDSFDQAATLLEQLSSTQAQMQPLVRDLNGVLRFKANPIVRHLLDTHPTCDLNELACMDFTDEDRQQFAQLIGYSLSGYGDLHYVSDSNYASNDDGFTKNYR